MHIERNDVVWMVVDLIEAESTAGRRVAPATLAATLATRFPDIDVAAVMRRLPAALEQRAADRLAHANEIDRYLAARARRGTPPKGGGRS
jgi:hypothetical protein